MVWWSDWVIVCLFLIEVRWVILVVLLMYFVLNRIVGMFGVLSMISFVI